MARQRTRAVAEEAAPIEILDDDGQGGNGIEFAIVVTTTLLLLGAVIVTMMALGQQYGRGPFGG